MGSRGAKSSVSTSAGSAGSGTTRPTIRRINEKVVNDWLDNQDAGRFISDAAPESISIGGVDFNWIGDSKTFDSRGRTEHRNTYQSSTQAANGEYPVIETVVKELKRGRDTRYEFDRSALTGSGLK